MLFLATTAHRIQATRSGGAAPRLPRVVAGKSSGRLAWFVFLSQSLGSRGATGEKEAGDLDRLCYQGDSLCY